MSIATPTLLPRPSRFPHLLPRPPRPHPIPLPYQRVYGHLNAVRDLQREMEDLSDEENELEDINLSIHNRGYSFLVPIGRSLTQQEEKNDADEDSEDSGSARSGGPPSVGEDDGENEESFQDLDASMEDLDEEGALDSEDNDMGEGDTEDFHDEPSEV
ncbi:hypothetical protein DXG03_005714 [Asterophora parasitica]|uniref:Uncharacterized protein n=1 Tax=Asterophora parasitica TaxID=117018 RepID=A0A9P7G973_9AGAR|nr:hypothetical protein DXG03_005714 [Asterophora parasitica]